MSNVISPPARTWSHYQREIFDWVDRVNEEVTREAAAISAVAGSGKTTVLLEALKRMTGKIAFFAFNVAIANELKNRAPRHAYVRTIHSLGFATLRRACRSITVPDPVNSKIVSIVEQIMGTEKDEWEARSGAMALARLCKLTLTDPSKPEDLKHLLDYYDVNIGEDDNEDWICEVMPDILDACLHDTIYCDFDDQLWMPIAMGLTPEKYDWVGVDECQDLSNVQRALVLKARAGSFLAVGDPHQCQPPGTMVCTRIPGNRWEAGKAEWRPIEKLSAGDQVLSWDRRSCNWVASATVNATKVQDYSGPMFQVSADGKSTRCTPNHKWIVRWTPKADNRVHVTYLMKKGNWYRVGRTQLFADNGDLFLARRAQVEKADAMWILKMHQTKTEAVIHEAVISATYGLPQLVFKAPWNMSCLTQNVIDRTYSTISASQKLSQSAIECLEYHGRDIRFPFYQRYARQKWGKKSCFVTEACNLIPEFMSVCIENGDFNDVHNKTRWMPLHTEMFNYTGPVYSLDVEKFHLYIADGLLTHNSIMGFAGANCDSFDLIVQDSGAQILPLSICYRCPSSHVALAQKLVHQIEPAPTADLGVIRDLERDQLHGHIHEGDMLICRTNAPLANVCMELVRNGVKAMIKGRDIGKNLISLVRRMHVRDGSITSLIARLEDYRHKELVKFVEQKRFEKAISLDDRIETLYALSDGVTGISELEANIADIFRDDRVGVTLSSVHRAKGLEANNVFLLRPDLMPHPMAKTPWSIEQEKNLKYVALTRAKKELSFVNDPTARQREGDRREQLIAKYGG